jgi:hypothetical protein
VLGADIQETRLMDLTAGLARRTIMPRLAFTALEGGICQMSASHVEQEGFSEALSDKSARSRERLRRSFSPSSSQSRHCPSTIALATYPMKKFNVVHY